jgi:Ca2+-binding EF-hand superfamily protein
MSSLAEHSAVKLSDGQVEKLIDGTYRKFDVDGDGQISFPEFHAEVLRNPSILDCVTLDLQALLK